MNDPEPHDAAPDPPSNVDASAQDPQHPAADAEALVRLVPPAPAAARRIDPEDWSRSGGDDDERYHRERPPHWG